MRPLADTWSESTTTWNARPAHGGSYVVSGTPTAGQWVDTPLPVGAVATSSATSLALRYTAAYSSARFASRENATNVITPGDQQYRSGQLSEYQQYDEPTWGRRKAGGCPARTGQRTCQCHWASAGVSSNG